MSAVPMNFAPAADLPEGATPAATPATWCLRFNGGAMRGRTLALQPGINVLGSAAGCDVLLPGSDVLPRHLQLHVGAWAVAVQRLGDAPLAFNGAPMGARRRGLVVGDRLGIGHLELVLDRAEPAPVADVPEGPDAMFAPESDAPPHLSADALPVPAMTGARRWRLVGGFALAFVAAVALLWALLGPPGAAGEHALQDDLGRLRKALADHPEVSLLAPPGGAIRVTGFVESALRRQQLEQLLQPFGTRVELRVQAVDGLVDQARRYIADPAIAITYGGQGRLVLSGATDNAALQDKILRLGQDLHPTVLVTDRVQYKPRAASDETASTRSLWRNWQNLLPDRVVSITEDADGARHIQLAGGQRVYEGAILKSGAQLKLLSPEELVIQPPPAGGAAP